MVQITADIRKKKASYDMEHVVPEDISGRLDKFTPMVAGEWWLTVWLIVVSN